MVSMGITVFAATNENLTMVYRQIQVYILIMYTYTYISTYNMKFVHL